MIVNMAAIGSENNLEWLMIFFSMRQKFIKCTLMLRATQPFRSMLLGNCIKIYTENGRGKRTCIELTRPVSHRQSSVGESYAMRTILIESPTIRCTKYTLSVCAVCVRGMKSFADSHLDTAIIHRIDENMNVRRMGPI